VLEEIWVLDAHILAVPGENCQLSIVVVNLCTLSIVLVLAGELLALEAVEDLRDCLRRLGEHGLEGHAWRKLDRLAELLRAALEERRNDEIVRRALGEDLFDNLAALLQVLGDAV
jgi:hypothetical protein